MERIRAREDFYERSCLGKHRHETEVQARRQAIDLEKSKPGEKFDHYYCDFCLGWHTGHKIREAADGSGHHG